MSGDVCGAGISLEQVNVQPNSNQIGFEGVNAQPMPQSHIDTYNQEDQKKKKMDDENKTASWPTVSSDEVKVIANGVDTGKVITTQPIPEDPSASEPAIEKKRSNNMVSTQRSDDRYASCNYGAGADSECDDVILGCLLCQCLFGGDGSGGGDCGHCFSACDCDNCDCDCDNCDCDCDDCDCDFD